MMLLQARRRMTARELATELEVSLRTVYRDVDALAAAGVPVYAEHGRTGGYQLVDGYRTRLTGLTEDEAQSLFMVGLPGPAEALGLSAEVASAERKLLAALGPDQRLRAGRLRDRFHLDLPSWYARPIPEPHLGAIAEAVLNDRVIDVVYRRWAAPREVERRLAPYGLVLKGGGWYLVAAAAHRDGEARIYRVANILQITPAEERFSRPAGFELAAHWQRHLAEFEQRRFTGRAVVRVSPGLAGRLRDLSDPTLRTVVEDTRPGPDGWYVVEVPIESEGQAARQLIRYGADVEVLSPPSLRTTLRELAREVAAVYEVGALVE
jgi:predicted DNA-binding transcriptional regulator YafY